MCGVPFHAANSYIQRLVKKAIKWLFANNWKIRLAQKDWWIEGIIKIITIGTYMDATMDAKSTNYMASCEISSFEITVIYCELSTGS